MAKKKKYKKGIILEVLTDPLHYLGWAITTGAVIGVFHLLKVHVLHSKWYYILALYITIMGVDLIKHKVKLQ